MKVFKKKKANFITKGLCSSRRHWLIEGSQHATSLPWGKHRALVWRQITDLSFNHQTYLPSPHTESSSEPTDTSRSNISECPRAPGTNTGGNKGKTSLCPWGTYTVVREQYSGTLENKRNYLPTPWLHRGGGVRGEGEKHEGLFSCLQEKGWAS